MNNIRKHSLVFNARIRLEYESPLKLHVLRRFGVILRPDLFAQNCFENFHKSSQREHESIFHYHSLSPPQWLWFQVFIFTLPLFTLLLIYIYKAMCTKRELKNNDNSFSPQTNIPLPTHINRYQADLVLKLIDCYFLNKHQ